MDTVAWIASGTSLTIVGALLSSPVGWVLFGIGLFILLVVACVAAS